MKKIMVYFILIQFCFLSVFAQDQLIPAKLKYGPEWTFTLSRTGPVSNLDVFPYRKKIWEQFKKHCKQSQICTVSDQLLVEDFKVTFKNGWVIEVASDPGVLEVKSMPNSLREITEMREFIQKNVFDQFKKIKMIPHEREGAGHTNIDLNYFLDKPLLLYNFIVDFYNHPGLGVVLNSLSANEEDARYIDQMSEWHWAFDHVFNFHFKSFKGDVAMLQKKLQSRKSNVQIYDVINVFNKILNAKYVALGIRDVDSKSLNPKSRLEFRALRPQANAFDYQLVLEIIEARINYLKSFNHPITLAPVKIDDGWLALGQYTDYLEESGLDYERYKSLMPDLWRDLNKSNFIRDTKLKHHIVMKCEGIFK